MENPIFFIALNIEYFVHVLWRSLCSVKKRSAPSDDGNVKMAKKAAYATHSAEES